LSHISEKWRKVLERCLVVDPGERVKSAAELKTLLKNASDGNSQENTTVVEDKTFVEGTKQNRKRPVTPAQNKQSKPSAPAHNQHSASEQPVTPSPSRKHLPWIIGGVATGVILAVVVGITLGKGKTNKPVDKPNLVTEEPSAIISSPEVKALAKTYTANGVSFTMKYVKGGTFKMGATSEQGSAAYNDEEPVHIVTLSNFCIGETEVTQALWKAVMGNNPSYFKGDNLPVENISWEDCQKFIQKLNQLTGKTFRLPTEAEWEYAARGGNKSKEYKYAGNNNIGDVAWYKYNSSSTTHPVKGKQANELGLYDMSGNVWEWCSDCFGIYNSSAQTNPEGSSSGSYHVLRGGSWISYDWRCRVSSRNRDTHDIRDNINGFRLVLVNE
jgi:formylglycine-generating enzyme required for sulfatase activity